LPFGEGVYTKAHDEQRNYATWLEIDLNAITANYNRLKRDQRRAGDGGGESQCLRAWDWKRRTALQHIGRNGGVARIEEDCNYARAASRCHLVLGYTSPKGEGCHKAKSIDLYDRWWQHV
jgi:hypothetical protein